MAMIRASEIMLPIFSAFPACQQSAADKQQRMMTLYDQDHFVQPREDETNVP
jgi:hypothetical protein